ncbi:MAG: hypothetical protein KDC98_09115 [Planctomycetes bacterium]|nr:hypothetical protein [Planctomycetota bacterium]
MTGYRSALLVALFGFSPVLIAQDSLDRELDFVRALAEKMKFIELAKEEVERLAVEHRGAGDQDRIAQLSVQISFHGAKARGDRSVQRTLYKEAIEKSKELIDRSSDAKVLVQARSTLADASQEFGQFLIEELELARETNPDAVKDLEDEAAAVYRAGIDACKKVREALEPQRKDPEKDIEFGLFWMRTGVLMREQGRAVKADRGVLVDRAIEELTELVLDFGEETAIGLRGLFEIAQCSEVNGDVGTAVDTYRATIDQISSSLTDADELGLPGNVQALLFEMVQEVFVRAGETMMRQGDPNTGSLFTEFREKMAKFGEPGVPLFDVVSPRWGHLMLLAEARFNAESGDSSKVADALTMVQRINDKHPRDYVGIKAKAALRDILAGHESHVSGALLFEIAKGEFQEKNYESAIKGLRRAIAAMGNQEASQHGLEAWHMLGTAFAITDRYLEAVLALGIGLQRHGNDQKDQAGDAADTLDQAIGRLKRQSKDDPAFAAICDTYLPFVAEFSIAGAGKIFYKEANQAYNDKDYARAIQKYAEVPPDFMFFELCKVRIAKAYAMSGDFDNARGTLATYAQYRGQNPIDSRDSGKQQVRDGATTEADFLLAQMAYWQARGNEQLGKEKTPTMYPEAIQKLREFITNHGGDDNAPIAIEFVGRLHSDIGEMDRAEQAYAELKQKDPPRAARLATEIFVEYSNQVKSFERELNDAIAKDNADAEKAASTEIDRLRAKIGALGLDYMSNSSRPQLAVMVNTMLAFEALGDWKRVDEIAQKALDQYGSDASEATRNILDLTVRPRIGEALLQQRKFTDALKMLQEAEKANPGQWELKRQIARCLGGWFEFDRNGQAAREPGLDRAAEAYMKYYTEYRPWAERPEVAKFSLEWYRFQWECYWFAKQASLKDSDFKARAEAFYRTAKSTDNFETLKSYGPEGKKLHDYFQINR